VSGNLPSVVHSHGYSDFGMASAQLPVPSLRLLKRNRVRADESHQVVYILASKRYLFGVSPHALRNVTEN
jgi:hypothetical protein